MIDFSSNSAFCNKVLSADKLFSDDIIDEFGTDEVNWLMTIKPGIRNVEKYINDRVRMEEIEVFSIKVTYNPSVDSYVRVLKEICSKVVYPCIVFIIYGNKFKIAAWNFVDSVKAANINIMRSYYCTSWMYEPAASEKTEKCINEVSDILLNGEGSVKKLYDSLCMSIMRCSPQYIGSKAHLERIVYDLTGKKNNPIINGISTSVRHDIKGDRNRYKKREYSSTYKYTYDYEDIWFAFMNDEVIKKTIENRRYRDIEDLVLTIDSKYENSSEW